MFEPCDEVKLFGNFLKHADELASVKQAAEDAEYNYTFENDYVKEIFRARGCELFNKQASAIDSTISERVETELKKEAEEIEKLSEEDPVIAVIKQKKAAELQKKADSVKEAFGFIEGMFNRAKEEGKPSISATTNSDSDNRDRAFLLQELAYTDPILSKMPSKKVVDSYEQMLRLSPEISKEKELVRAFLRQSTAGQAVDPFMGSQLVEADTKLLKQRRLHSGLSESGNDSGFTARN
jgi:molybdenum-dependent DNA-binding transcriptional regulator ModE